MDRSRHSGIFPVLLLVVGTALGGCSGGAQEGTVSPAAPASSAASPSSPPPPAATATPAATPAATPSSPSAWDAPTGAALPDATASKLQGLLDGWAFAHGVTGLSAAVVTPTGSWAGATGADAAGTAIKPTSAFAIADITMTFVGAEVLLLASHGKIDLEGP